MTRCAILALLLLALAAPVLAAGTITEDVQALHDNLRVMTVRWYAGADSTFSPHDLSSQINGRILKIVSKPDTSASTYPLDNYDITLTSPDSLDVLGGAGANRDSLTVEAAYPLSGSTIVPGGVPVHGTHRLKIDNIKGAGTLGPAKGIIRIYYELMR